jgi:hypothetical protein
MTPSTNRLAVRPRGRYPAALPFIGFRVARPVHLLDRIVFQVFIRPGKLFQLGLVVRRVRDFESTNQVDVVRRDVGDTRYFFQIASN